MTEQTIARPTFMTIERGHPPNIDKIVARFGPVVMNPGVIFTYGTTIWNPSGRPLSNALMRHEEVHARQQALVGVEEWWDRYLRDDEFRFLQEMDAHVAEWKAVLDGESNRAHRREMLTIIAKRLSGPLYGRLATYDNVKRMLKKAGMEEVV